MTYTDLEWDFSSPRRPSSLELGHFAFFVHCSNGQIFRVWRTEPDLVWWCRVRTETEDWSEVFRLTKSFVGETNKRVDQRVRARKG